MYHLAVLVRTCSKVAIAGGWWRAGLAFDECSTPALRAAQVYAKIGDEDKVLSYKKGKWTVGDRARPGGKQSRTRAYLSTDAAAPLTKLASGESGESGEAAQCAWQINVENKWQEQPGVVAVELTEEEVEAEQERLRAASAAAERAALDAAPYLRVSGAALADGSPNDWLSE